MNENNISSLLASTTKKSGPSHKPSTVCTLKSTIEVKKIKPGKYSTSFDENNQMLIAKVS
jgi:hypothetical protein